ncbi:MAG: amino acid ABC transporter permease, partial [Lapillicoccus sp.]
QIITYPELLNTYQQIGSTWSNIVPAMFVIALIFILINYTLTTIAARVEGRLRRRGRSTLAAGGGAPTPGTGGSVAPPAAPAEAGTPA